LPLTALNIRENMFMLIIMRRPHCQRMGQAGYTGMAMNSLLRTISLTIAVAFLAALCAHGAHAFTAVVDPVELTQGDPFMLIVKDTEAEPEASFNSKELSLSPCGEGCWVTLGLVPLGTEPGKHHVRISEQGLGIGLSINVALGNFPVQHLTLPEDKVNLSPEDEARADEEAARLKALWKEQGPRFWDGDFIMPLEGGVSTGFGVKRIMNKEKTSVHSGLDIRGNYGTPVLAANSGRVAVVDDLFFGGNTVVIDHGSGIYSVYMHLQEQRVTEGEPVARGEVIGLVGSTGRSTGPHLHYTVKLASENVNPHSLARLPVAKAVSLTNAPLAVGGPE
jgi:hypothetical protein